MLAGTASALVALAFASALPAVGAGIPGRISTIAGGVGGPGPARSVSFQTCATSSNRGGCGLSFAGGNLYFTDLGPLDGDGLVRQVSLKTGALTSPAGDGQTGDGGDSGLATRAQFSRIQDVSSDSAGNLLVTDGARVRVVAAKTGSFYGQSMTAHHVYTVAGGGTGTNDGQPATHVKLSPLGAVVDRSGNIVIWDRLTVRVVARTTGTLYGQAMTAGDIYTVAGPGHSRLDGVSALKAEIFPLGVAVDGSGNLVLAGDYAVRVVAVRSGRFYGQAMKAGDIYTIAGGGHRVADGGPATNSLANPEGVALDRTGNVIVADGGDRRVRVVAVRAGRFYGQAMKAGDIYTVTGGGANNENNSKNGVVATKAWLLPPRAVAVDSAGNIALIGDSSTTVQLVPSRTGTYYGVHAQAGHIYAIAGNGLKWTAGEGGLATKAQILPVGGAVASDDGNLAMSVSTPDSGTFDPVIELLANRSGQFFGQKMTAGHLYRIAGNGQGRFAGNRALATKSGFAFIMSMTSDRQGNLLISDDVGDRVLVVAEHSGQFYGRSMLAGHIYSIAGTGRGGDSGNGGPAVKAKIGSGSLGVDQNGNVLLRQSFLLRVVAERTGTFYGIGMKAGNIYLVSSATEGTGGDGGPVGSAQFEVDGGLTVDGPSGVILADGFRLRMVATATGTFFGVHMTAGNVYTIAGTGNKGVSADGGPALGSDLSAEFPVLDSAGNLVFRDYVAKLVRVVAGSTGTFYGFSMTAGHLYSIAVGGSSGSGPLGDGGPSLDATFGDLGQLAADSAGVAVSDDLRIRQIAGP
ncbi:MAG TPA: hypothetical protein VFI65_13070 [Streptosporangiaceae bacterium]|nr:hypothetical protein [Streptosporangiaceae bacterium]